MKFERWFWIITLYQSLWKISSRKISSILTRLKFERRAREIPSMLTRLTFERRTWEISSCLKFERRVRELSVNSHGMVTHCRHDLNMFAESFTEDGGAAILEANAITRIVDNLGSNSLTDSPTIKHHSASSRHRSALEYNICICLLIYIKTLAPL